MEEYLQWKRAPTNLWSSTPFIHSVALTSFPLMVFGAFVFIYCCFGYAKYEGVVYHGPHVLYTLVPLSSLLFSVLKPSANQPSVN